MIPLWQMFAAPAVAWVIYWWLGEMFGSWEEK